ncbi:DNA-binding protein [Aeromicrobium sp. UC242_57]|uniref:DNA-binding protein n=1 Tax=Aeromicrobium sp. UC242_57 TaxID=3374624 RepID=UPI0037A8A128
MGLFSRTLDRLSSEKQEAGELQNDATRAGCQLICSLPDRSVVSIHGVLRSVTLRPVDGVTALEARLYDGSRQRHAGLAGASPDPGHCRGPATTAHGRIGTRTTERVLYNPRYELDA